MEAATTTDYTYRNRPRIKTVSKKKRPYWHLTLYEILTLICAAAIPIALGIYTGITYEQQQQESDRNRQLDFDLAAELRQQTLYDKFLNDMYNLEKDGHLNDDKSPWAFANAYFRAAHRQWDTVRKADVLQFLKEKQLIGRHKWTNRRTAKQTNDTIRLNELSFDRVHLTSQTGSLNQLNLQYISFDQVSMVNARFAFVNLDDTSFDLARLNDIKFDDSSLVYASFHTTQLRRADFGNSNLTNTRFFNVDLSTAKLTQDQIQQAIFYNTIMPNGTLGRPTTTTTSSSTTTSTITSEELSTLLQNTTNQTMEIFSTTTSTLHSVNETTASSADNQALTTQ